ncbi:MAG TPA: hypothetical protein VFV93_12585 [Thermomicrobiales bacterium]|nr:hypothetical protein [Thermomicrobiales bacterium]
MEQTVTIEGIRRYTIHGEPYAVIYYSLAGDRETIHQTQLSEDALPNGLQVGETAVITRIGTIVAGVHRP